MKKLLLFVWLPFKWLWKFLAAGMAVLSGLFFLALCVLMLTAIFYRPEVKVPENSVLLFSPRGDIVEKRSPIDPVARLVNNLAGVEGQKEIALQDVLDGIYAGADDPRISVLLIKPDRLGSVSLDQIRAIGDAIDYFKQTGKKVIAAADTYNPAQYYLSSWADEIYLHSMGAARLRGFGIFRLYFKDLMDKLAVDFHVFRVGTFKSAVEPLLRNDMSDEARSANREWLNALWNVYSSDIAEHRNMTGQQFSSIVNSYPSLLQSNGGDHSRTALDNKLIDGIKTGEELTTYLTGIVGSAEDKRTFRQISFDTYLQSVTPTYAKSGNAQANVGIITAVGNIMYGEGPGTQIGSDTLIRQIRQARFDQRIKAVVLRISTGGGSAFASELIRQELVALKEAGKPVVISMGSVAASGGYWLAADADLIVASPLTLTGSIGIFGVIPTINKTLEKAGVHGDGVGTGTTALFGNPASPMSQAEKTYYQSSVEHGYRTFLEIVSRGRNLPLRQVEGLAQGKIWAGESALELGLVDRLGTLETAVAEAAKLAGIPEENAFYIQPAGTGLKFFLQQLNGGVLSLFSSIFPLTPIQQQLFHHSGENLSILQGLVADPHDIYAHSLLPASIIDF